VASYPFRANSPTAACRISSAIGVETWVSTAAYY
jgi:hypothetical protein